MQLNSINLAISQKRDSVVRLLMEHMDPERLSQSLMMAASMNSFTIVKMLLDHGVHCVDMQSWGDVKMTKLLIQHGMEWNDVSEKKFNGLHLC